MNIYLDDERTPRNPSSFNVICRSYDEIKAVFEKGLDRIGIISFDHDLGAEKTGMDVVKLLVEMDMDGSWGRLSPTFLWNVHSANPVGARNITEYLRNYLENRD